MGTDSVLTNWAILPRYALGLGFVQRLRQTLDKAQTIPKPVYSRLSSALQSIGGTLISAGIIGFAVIGDAVQPVEAGQIVLIGLTIFVCGTIIDIRTSK